MTASPYGWCVRQNGRELVPSCPECGRGTYVGVEPVTSLIRCDGCAEDIRECLCPDSRTAV